MSDQKSKDYARGYAAGRKRQQVDVDKEREWKVKNELWNRAYLSAFNALIQSDWNLNGESAGTLEKKAALARIAANAAVKDLRSNVP